MDLTPVLIVGVCCWVVYALSARIATRKERMRFMETMASMTPDQMASFKDSHPNWELMVKKDPQNALRTACLLLGIGLGLLIAWIIIYCTYGNLDSNEWYQYDNVLGFLLLACPLCFGGLGLLTAYLIDRCKKK